MGYNHRISWALSVPGGLRPVLACLGRLLMGVAAGQVDLVGGLAFPE